MKLKQELIIKQYFIDYSLGVYTNKKPTVSEELVKELSKPNYENQLELTKLTTGVTSADATFESEKVLTGVQTYDYSKPNEVSLFDTRYLDSATFPTVKDIPRDIVDDLVLIEDLENRKPVIFVSKEFKKLSVSDKFKHVLNIFKNRVQIDYSEPEVILGKTFDLEKDSSWDDKLNQLVISSAVLKGRICVVDDTRRFELEDTHIGRLTHGVDTFTSPWNEFSSFYVRDTDGVLHKLYAENTDLEPWESYTPIEGKAIEITVTEYGVEIGGDDLLELVTFPGPYIKDRGTDYSFAVSNSPNFIEVPEELPKHITDISYFGRNCTSFNSPNIAMWDYSSVKSIESFLYGAKEFNQDLSHICLSSTPTYQSYFLYDTSYSYEEPVPGECPDELVIGVTVHDESHRVGARLGEVKTIDGSDARIEFVNNRLKVSGSDVTAINLTNHKKSHFLENGINGLDFSGTNITYPPYPLETMMINGYKEISGAFKDCKRLEALNVRLNISGVESLRSLVEGCENLESITLGLSYSHEDPETGERYPKDLKLKDLSNLAKGCVNLKYFDISTNGSNETATRLVEDTSSMFEGCVKLSEFTYFREPLDRRLMTSNIKNAKAMFKGCKSLDDVFNFFNNWESLENADEMFMDCDGIKLAIHNWVVPKLKARPKDFIKNSGDESTIWNKPEPMWGVEHEKLIVFKSEQSEPYNVYKPVDSYQIQIPLFEGGVDISGDRLSFGIKYITTNYFRATYDILELNPPGDHEKVRLSMSRFPISGVISPQACSVIEEIDLGEINTTIINDLLTQPELVLGSLKVSGLTNETSLDISKLKNLKELEISYSNDYNQPIIADKDISLNRLVINDSDKFNQPIKHLTIGKSTKDNPMELDSLRAFNQEPPMPDPVKTTRLVLRSLAVFNQDLSHWKLPNFRYVDDIYRNCPKWTLPKPLVGEDAK